MQWVHLLILKFIHGWYIGLPDYASIFFRIIRVYQHMQWNNIE